ncbi:hypothetical protein LCGC14_0132070 [marine sediment metagenome]|uniref:Glycosyl transferase family 1 domain-containing protein n=1 Tax=marine sediment metagenome TaxID=412755 RepID=A0A0F9XKK5_9ZZZZ|nr:glycosyltransferase family 4 protein [Maribacter sp.]HDZ03943.1 glycosyltransferase family 4 protein [Maribacter sp.]HEC39443.1 glycosyltransferase family 4 protein [bacterium]
MKIDFLINSLGGGGAERVMTTLANGFSKKHAIRLITFNKGKDFNLDKEIKSIDLHEGKIKNHTVRSILNLYNYYKYKNNRPDILISFLPPNNLIAIIIARFLGIKVIISEHTNHTAKFGKKTELIQKLSYRFSNALTVLTTFDKVHFERLGANVCVMPNPLNLPTEIEPLYKREKTILIVGALNRYESKGFDSLIKIIAPILKKNKSWKLIIAGGGDQGLFILKNLTAELDIQSQVIFKGFCKNINELMQTSQIFVLPSKFEGLPMGLMEALSNGMACIAYNCPSGPEDLIDNNINGLLIKDQDTILMSEGISKLINEKELRNKLADNAPNSMIDYSLENILDRWDALIKSVIKND